MPQNKIEVKRTEQKSIAAQNRIAEQERSKPCPNNTKPRG